MNNPAIVILSFSPLDRDPRVQRQIRCLREHWSVAAAGFGDPGFKDLEYVSLTRPDSSVVAKTVQGLRLKTKRFEAHYWGAGHVRETYRRLAGLKPALILANDVDTLPLALRLARERGSKVLLDSHEYEPLHFNDDWLFNAFFRDYWDYICRTYLPRVDGMTTVCDSISERYAAEYGVFSNTISNAAPYHELAPKAATPGKIRMVHHGICNPSRRLENMIILVRHLDERFILDLMLVPDNPRYYRKLRKLAGDSTRIRFREPVPLGRIVPTLNDYDVGLFLLSPEAYNYLVALPNKLFEYVQARLAIAIWPSPEMAKVVTQYGLGMVADDFSIEAAAKSLNNLSAKDISCFKHAAHEAASVLCAENNEQKLSNIVGRLMDKC